MRLRINDLAPGVNYVFRLRSTDGQHFSEWSRPFPITVSSDTVAPTTPTGAVGSVSGSAFALTWNAVTTSADGTPAHDLDKYEVLVESPGTGTTKTFYTTGTNFQLTLDMNRQTFGTPRAAVNLSVRALDITGNASLYTTPSVLVNPAPAAPTGFTASALNDAISLKWNEVVADDLIGYRVYSGTTSGVQTTLEWSGSATSVTLSSTFYSIDRWYKVVAYDAFLTESTATVTGPIRPKSPFSVDTTAPSTPAGLAVTLTNAIDGKTSKADVTWTAVTDTDGDLSEYIIDYKPSSDSVWNTVKVDYEKTAVAIGGLLPYTNYDFRIRASDFSANLSAWSSTVSKTASTNAAPAVPTGLAITPGRDNIIVRWTANTEPDMANGAGVYDVTIATNSGFSTGVLQYRTGNDNIAVNGLSTNQIYYARVRATDSGGVSSAYSSSVNATTGTFPSGAASDGSAPSAAPTGVTVVGGVGYIWASWTAVTNNDPVTYDVYMSTTSGFTTYDATTKVGEVSGTSIIIENTAAGASVAYGTTYYVKVRARDRDGIGPISSQASSAPVKVGSSDVSSVNANLITAGTGFVTNLFIGTGGAIQSTGYTPGGSSGFSLGETGLTIKGSNNVVDAGVLKGGTITGTTINVGVGGTLNIDATGSLKSNNYSPNSTGYQLSSAGLEVNDGAIDAKTLRTGSAIIGDLIIGRSADALGSIKSFGYNAGVAGWKIDKSGMEINNGLISAAALRLQNSPNLVPAAYADFEYGNKYYISSFWNSLGQNGVAIAGALCDASVGTLGADVFKGSQTLSVDSLGGTSTVDLWFAPTSTGYNINVEAGKTYIWSAYVRNRANNSETWSVVVKGDNGSIISTTPFAMAASEPKLVRRSFAFTVPSSGVSRIIVGMSKPANGNVAQLFIDGQQVEEKTGADNTPSPWKPPGQTTVDGSGITTGQIRSSNTISVSGVEQPMWSINTQGNLQIGDALIRGKLIVGSSSEGLPNRAPGGGDFEANVNGYQAWHTDRTGESISRTTAAGEVINGSGSAKVVAAAGTGNLGIQFNTLKTYTGKTTVSITANVKVDADTPGSELIVFVKNSSGMTIDLVSVNPTPVMNTVYSISYSYTIPEGDDVASVGIYHSQSTATAFIIDDIKLTSDDEIGSSYVQSANFISGEGGSGWRIDGAGNVEFNTGFFRGQLGAGTVTAESLSSTITMSSTFRTAEDGQRVEFNSDGIIVYKEDDTPAVVLTADTSGSNSMFEGDLLASSLTIADQLAIRGVNNEIARGSTLTLASGTTSPNSPPTVSVDWKSIPANNGGGGWAAGRSGITVQGGWFRVALGIYGQGVVIESYHLTTGIKEYTHLDVSSKNAGGLMTCAGGITSIGDNIYILGQLANGAWRIMGWNVGTATSGKPPKVFDIAYTQGASDRIPALGNDGGQQLLIAMTNTTDNKVRLKTANINTGGLSSSVASNLVYGSDAAFINRGVFDNAYNQTVYVVGLKSGQTAWVMNSSFQRLAQYDFPLPVQPSGQCFYNGKFYTFDKAGSRIFEHTELVWNANTVGMSNWHAGNTWYNTDATNGNKQTMIGPLRSFTMKQRARVTVTSPPLPLRPLPNTVDDATAVGVYIARNSTTPTRAQMERIGYLPDGERSMLIDYSPAIPGPTGAAQNPPPANTDFPASAASTIRSSNDRLLLNGDGSGQWADLSVNTAGVLSVPGRLPRAYAVGTTTVPAVAMNASTGALTVNFPSGRFSTAPRVYLSCFSGRLNLWLSSTSATSFSFGADNWSNGNASSATTVYWYAVIE